MSALSTKSALEKRELLTTIIVRYWRGPRHMDRSAWLHYLLGMQVAAIDLGCVELAGELRMLCDVAIEIEFPDAQKAAA